MMTQHRRLHFLIIPFCIAITALFLVPAEAEVVPGPFKAHVPIRAKSATECPSVPPAVRTLKSAGFYTDRNFNQVSPEQLAAEVKSGRPLGDWLDVLQKQMERWISMGDAHAANCALDFLETWARNRALLGEMSTQGTFRRKWALAGAALAYLALRDAPGATAERSARIGTWLAEVAHQVTTPYERSPSPDAARNFRGDTVNGLLNNHVVWAGLAVAAAAVASGDRPLMRWGRQRGIVFLAGVRDDGMHPQEAARGRLALHYHLFALQPAAALSRLLDAAGEPLPVDARLALDRLAHFTFSQIEDDTRLVQLTGSKQEHVLKADTRSWLAEAAGLEIWGRDAAISLKLAPFRPFRQRWLGGNVTLLWKQ